MATSLVANVQYPISASGITLGGDLCIENVKRTPRNCQLSSVRWLVPTKALHEECWRGKHRIKQRHRKPGSMPVFAVVGKDVPDEDNDEEKGPSKEDIFRQQMEKMIGNDAKDANFEGKDLAQLIRNKYGRSYDVRLIKKEFLGRQLLAMNVMWKYREQRSFPLTEEEYLLHLDYIAQNLRGWGAVSYVRDSLERTRERPRIGKAVSIFINPDESGERAREWIKR